MKLFSVFLIKAYQIVVSPLFPSVCRFQPSCSEYALQAIEKYGSIKGGKMAVKRLLKCHPFSKRHGWDPVK
ncbi:membrane protein insertion efficiency factor YidD [candidate division KSB1 bacterium]